MKIKPLINLTKINHFFIIAILTFHSLVSHAEDKQLTIAGDILQIALPVGAAIFTYFQDDMEGFKQLATTCVISNGLTHLTKGALRKTSLSKRPRGGQKSFPSGHATSAYHGAFFLQHRYGWKLGAPAIGLATLVSYSRVAGKYHHTRDVIAGAVVAYAVSYFGVTKFNSNTTTINATYSKDEARVQLKVNL